MAWHAIIAPAARRFQPGLLMVSAGYDAHWRDPLEKQQFQSSTCHFLTKQLKLLADELCGGSFEVQILPLFASAPARHMGIVYD